MQLGNFHKYLALHCDEQIISYLTHIHAVWVMICDGDKAIMLKVDLESIRILQFRMPKVCPGDSDTIKRLFDSGALFPGVTDPGVRDRIMRNILSLNMVIPSFETLNENMKYLGIGAKILIRHVIDELPMCKSRSKRSPTIYELLSGSWTAPAVVGVESKDNECVEIEGPASVSLAFEQLFLITLRLFPWLQRAESTRQDDPAETIKVKDPPICVPYLLSFASLQGFRSSKIDQGKSDVTDPGPLPGESWREMPDWRGGRPFTRTFWAFRTNAFLPRLASMRRRQPNPEFVLLDMMTAFFGQHNFVLKTPLEEDDDLEMGNESDDGAENNSNQEDLQMDDAPGAPTGKAPSDKIKPKSRLLGSTRQRTTAKGHEKLVNRSAVSKQAIPRREAARSVMVTPSQSKEGQAQLGRRVPVPDIPSSTAHSVSVEEQIATASSSTPETSNTNDPAAPVPVPGIPNSTAHSVSVEEQIATTSSSTPETSNTNDFDLTTAPSWFGTTGREAARSVFVVNPNVQAKLGSLGDLRTLSRQQNFDVSNVSNVKESLDPSTISRNPPTLDKRDRNAQNHINRSQNQKHLGTSNIQRHIAKAKGAVQSAQRSRAAGSVPSAQEFNPTIAPNPSIAPIRTMKLQKPKRLHSQQASFDESICEDRPVESAGKKTRVGDAQFRPGDSAYSGELVPQFRPMPGTGADIAQQFLKRGKQDRYQGQGKRPEFNAFSQSVMEFSLEEEEEEEL